MGAGVGAAKKKKQEKLEIKGDNADWFSFHFFFISINFTINHKTRGKKNAARKPK